MKGFTKWFFIGHFIIVLIIVWIITSGEIDSSSIGKPLVIILISTLSIDFLVYFLEVKFRPMREIKLTNKLIDLFKAEPVSEGIMKFTISRVDFYTEIEIDLKRSLHGANAEIVRFHVPRNQIDRLTPKSRTELREDTCNGVQTYHVYQTNGTGLVLAKGRFEKMIEKPTTNNLQ